MIDFVGPAQVHERHASSGVWVHLTCILKCLTYKSFPQAIDFTVHEGNRQFILSFYFFLCLYMSKILDAAALKSKGHQAVSGYIQC